MKSITVTIADQSFEIKPLPMRPARQWRELMTAALERIGVADLLKSQFTRTDDEKGIKSVIESVKSLVVSVPDLALDLLIEYSPELAEHRELIETKGYDDEVIRAFAEVVQMAIPLAEIRQAVAGLTGTKTSKR